ncbi:MAG: DNA repair protein RecN [Chloroflexota bacterium]
MLTELRIQDFAIIDQLELSLGAGLITFTGETGAGKSIIIDALGTLLGSWVDITMIRTGADRSIIEGTFYPNANIRAPIHEILKREDLLDDPDHLILAREIRRSKRNIARVNGHSVSLALMRELGEYLVDIHGQSEHLSLLRVPQHLELLDRYAECEPQLEDYRQTYQKLKDTHRALNTLKKLQEETARQIDLLNYQINEIETAKLRPGEDDELLVERNRLSNAESLVSLIQKTLMALDESTPQSLAFTDLLGQAVENLLALSRIDPSQKEIAQRAQNLSDTLTDLTHDLRNYLETIEFNPSRLEQVEERINLIQDLKHKYGNSIHEVLAFADQARKKLETFTTAEERQVELQVREEHLLNDLTEKGLALSKKRHTTSDVLCRSIEQELADLRMSGTRFGVDIQMTSDPNGVPLPDGKRVVFGPHGFEHVEFLVAPNPGEGLKPLTKIASGGETSRLMLALKHVLVQADQTPTLIFDEIDQGIGGRVGATVGLKLWTLARQHQVLCVTHLPQLAAYGDQHYHVHKLVQEGRTVTRLESLSGESRVLELAQMLGDISEGTLRSAHELLQTVQTQTTNLSIGSTET